MAVITRRDPDTRGYFGDFGGRYVPETLVEPVEELERAYFQVRDDPEFAAELAHLLKHYVGRPTPLYEARRLSKEYGGTRIFLKREDLTHTGAHKINNALGSMASRQPPPARFSASSVMCTWALKTWPVRRPTSSACGCSARKCAL